MNANRVFEGWCEISKPEAVAAFEKGAAIRCANRREAFDVVRITRYGKLPDGYTYYQREAAS